MKAIASSFIGVAAAIFWRSSVQLPDCSSIQYFGMLISLLVLWMALAGFWRSWSPEEHGK